MGYARRIYDIARGKLFNTAFKLDWKLHLSRIGIKRGEAHLVIPNDYDEIKKAVLADTLSIPAESIVSPEVMADNLLRKLIFKGNNPITIDRELEEIEWQLASFLVKGKEEEREEKIGSFINSLFPLRQAFSDYFTLLPGQFFPSALDLENISPENPFYLYAKTLRGQLTDLLKQDKPFFSILGYTTREYNIRFAMPRSMLQPRTWERSFNAIINRTIDQELATFDADRLFSRFASKHAHTRLSELANQTKKLTAGQSQQPSSSQEHLQSSPQSQPVSLKS
ncbi:MAG: hypothetical protein PHH14_07500 [Candidatus Margulisbacteria bacterium]|nr:hypothetical protein [Candidatus Margulisiibacteriota bacterium]